jgi:mono/diheme cytochrome c family protein
MDSELKSVTDHLNKGVGISAMRTARNLIMGIAVILLFTACMVAAAPLSASPTTQDAPPSPLTGKDLYAQNCAPCHGETGNGDGPSASGLSVPPIAFADPNALAGKSLAELFDITKNGNMQRMMPPWKNRLDEAQIWDAVAYAWTLHTTPAQVDMGKAVYAANCASCHGADGKGTATGPNLTDFAATSKVSQAAWAQTIAGGKGKMPAFGDKLSAAEQAAGLEYVRSLAFGGPMFRGPLAKGTGVISGTVTNGTTGAAMPDLTIELGIFDQTSVLEQRSTKTDAAGLFRFVELPTDAGLAFAARGEYPQGIPFGSEFVSFEPGKSELNLPLTISETTTDPSGIRADRVHFIVDFAPGQAQIAELMVFSLDGNRTYVGDGSGVLRFTLPAGAQGLAIDGDTQDGRYQVTADGFVDHLPLQPGQSTRQVLYRYTLPYTGDKLDFARTLPYAAANVNALVTDIGQQVTSDQLISQGVRQTQQGNFYNLAGQNLPAGQPLTIHMTGLAAAAGSEVAAASTGGGNATGRILLWVLIGLAATGAVLLVALPLLRRRGAEAKGAATRDELVDALARLDMAHEAGELSDAAYRDERMRLKAQLRDLTQ